MNSCLYTCEVMHHRLSPKEHTFSYNIFMFYIDLDELDKMHQSLRLFSRNAFNWFSFKDTDHVQFPFAERNSHTAKENITAYLRSNDIDPGNGKIMLLTNVTTLGHNFNPISFYICFDENNQPLCSVAEVCNTHGEMKLYLIGKENLSGATFRKMVSKHFYVSPFADLDTSFDFIFTIPGEKMLMRVDDYEKDKRFLLSSLTGKKKTLSDATLLWYGIRFPFITIKIVFLIYWQAFILYLKKMPFHRKNFNMHLQKDAYNYKKA